METDDLIIVEVFCKEYQIEINLIHDLEEFGLIETITQNKKRYLHSNQLAKVERIIRLHNELKINKEGIDVILDLLQKVNKLNSEVKYLKNKLGLYE